jgi:2Fe-2S ferredoxin
MPRITYVQPDGNGIEIEIEVGKSVMQGALENAIKGIVAECGGELACATCHCYVDDEWIDNVGPAGAIEDQMLDCAASSKKAGSRLSCQIVARDDLNGLVVHLPASQI